MDPEFRRMLEELRRRCERHWAELREQSRLMEQAMAEAERRRAAVGRVVHQ